MPATTRKRGSFALSWNLSGARGLMRCEQPYPRARRSQLSNSSVASFFNELRQSKGSFTGGIDNSLCDDQLFPDDGDGWGPCKDEDEFTQALVNAWSTNYPDDPFIRLVCQIQLSVMEDHGKHMTHNDFAPGNILVEGSRVVAILDWQQSGFYP